MEFNEIIKKKSLFQQRVKTVSSLAMESFLQAFSVEYTHHSTAIEGNTLTLMETKVVLEDKISIGGKKLREIYEIVNHDKAYQYINECIKNGMRLNEKIIKDIHAILTENIMVGGVYRNEPVYITGAAHRPPSGTDMYIQVKNFYADLEFKEKQMDSIELAAWTHAEFVKIHPFLDGNGRTSRLIMNYQLISQGFMPIIIKKEDALKYYDTLEAYAVENDLKPFYEMILYLETEQLDNFNQLFYSKEEIEMNSEKIDDSENQQPCNKKKRGMSI